MANDAYRERGYGIGTTYAGRIPLLRIDYVFADPQLNVSSFEIIKDHFSDHYAVATTLEWKEVSE